MYTKRGDVAAYHIVWIGLCLRSVLGVLVLASAVDDWLSCRLGEFALKQIVVSRGRICFVFGLNNSDFGKDIITP